MTGHPDTSLTIDTHHHMLPDFFWRETDNAHAPVGGLAPLRWSKDASLSFIDDAASRLFPRLQSVRVAPTGRTQGELG
jgi:hypothetical protein